MQNRHFSLLILSILLLGGCITARTNISKESLFVENGNLKPTLFWAHYDATQRGGLYLVNPKTDGTVEIKVISEPPPDAGMSTTIDAILKVKVTDQFGIGTKFSAVKAVAELGKRNAANYMVRDIAFRIESLQNNSGKMDPEVVSLYKLLMTTAENISVAESKADMTQNKLETLKEINKLLSFAKDSANNDLGLDSTFFDAIEKLIK